MFIVVVVVVTRRRIEKDNARSGGLFAILRQSRHVSQLINMILMLIIVWIIEVRRLVRGRIRLRARERVQVVQIRIRFRVARKTRCRRARLGPFSI